MNNNIYWPVFKNIESEFVNLMYSIHIDDNQLNVYSSKISDLILRSATEIESLAKELYKINDGTKTENIKYDEIALQHLNKLWNLDHKKVILSSYNCFITNKIIIPFEKKEVRTKGKGLTYSWNNSYQNLKHDRANSLQFGSIKYLIDILSALFILNIYYKNTIYDLNNNSTGSNFDIALGSSVFSIKTHVSIGISDNSVYKKNEDFHECVYLIKPTDDTKKKAEIELKNLNEENAKYIERNKHLILPKLFDSTKTESKEEILRRFQKTAEEIGKKSQNQAFMTMGKTLMEAFQSLKYEAVLNTNQY